MDHHYELPPAPAAPHDALRWQESRRRRRMLEGAWGTDLEDRLLQHFGPTRTEIMGPKSRSKNPFKKLCDDLAVLYIGTPKARQADLGELLPLLGPDGLVTKAGLWPQMRKVQTYTIGLREMLVRADWSSRLGGLTYRMVTPDTVVALSHPDSPGVPVEIRELRWREVPGIGGRWCWDVLSIANPTAPTYRIVECSDRNEIDWTERILGGNYSGAAYPYRRRDGTPVLPYVMYHAETASQLWNAHDWVEIVDASLDVAACATFFLHAVFRASWPQRWAMGAGIVGAVAENGRTSVTVDVSSLVHLEPTDQGVQPQIGQWGPGCEVDKLQQAISAYETSVQNVAGVDAANIVRSSGDAWSGAALSISRDGKREAQRTFAPQFRDSDLRLIELSAVLANRFGGHSFPESGYRIDYAALPLSPQELDARRRHHTELIAAGRMSPVEAYQEEHPGTTRDEAISALDQIRQDVQRFSPAPVPQGAQTPAEPTIEEPTP